VKAFVLLIAISCLLAPLLPAQENYGTIHATTRVRPDGSSSTTVVDPDKHTAEETIRDGSKPPKVLKQTTYLLGENDIATAAIFKDPKGAVLYKATYTRDGAGHVTEASFTAADGRYLGKRVFVYGAGDTATQVIDYDANGQQIAQAQPVAPKKKKH
jgi:hypothetical protein